MKERLHRLESRQRLQFGSALDPGGTMAGEHRAFMAWAAEYGIRTGAGRHAVSDRNFPERVCPQVLILTDIAPLRDVAARITDFVAASGTTALTDGGTPGPDRG